MPEPQNLKNHARFDPVWHFFLGPLILLNLIYAIAATIHHWPMEWHHYFWWAIMSLVFFMAVGKARSHSLKAQDRIIRLEERLRLASLLPADQYARCLSLTEPQLIGLRFASDAELPALAIRALDENLTNKQIKQAINNWKPDYFRI